MSVFPPEIAPILQYAAPPVVGAFIGYLTNKIAIKMLFRPLNPWKILGIRVPMTPGVIPSKRGELAENMGRMVADYLLTTEELSKSLHQKDVQEQLYKTIAFEGEKLAGKDLGTLQSLLPSQFSCYYGHGVQYLCSKLTSEIEEYLQSEEVAQKLQLFLQEQTDEFLSMQTTALLSATQQESAFATVEKLIEKNITSFLESREFEGWVEQNINSGVSTILNQNKTLEELLPDSCRVVLVSIVEKYSASLLVGLAGVIKEPSVREKLVSGACGGVENFISSMGPMAAMVSNFVKMDTVREKITEYLDDHEEDIALWIQSPEMAVKISEVLIKQLDRLFKKPLAEMIKDVDLAQIESISSGITQQIITKLRDQSVIKDFTALLVSRLQQSIANGTSVGETLDSILGHETKNTLVLSVHAKIIHTLQSPSLKPYISTGVEQLVSKILSHKVGKLSRMFNENMRKSIYASTKDGVVTVLEREVPHILHSFQLHRVIADKINSLDLIRLEQLLLSIMEEQFKYINLFGAILGFFLGCINIIFILLS